MAIQHGATKKTPALVGKQDDEEKKLFDYPAAMRCHNFTDCPPSVECSCSCLARPAVCSSRVPRPYSLSGHRNCYISESLLTSGLWLQQLMESFPPARLAHSFDSANQLAVPADHSIKSSFHFVFSPSPSFFFFWCFLLLLLLLQCTAHGALRLR